MRRVTLRSLWDHKRRLISTIIAIVLGVAFLTGTFVFADTLNKVFDDLFETANENVDARIQGEVVISGQGGGDRRGRFDESLVDTVVAVEGVSAVAPSTVSFGGGPINRILDADGEPVGAAAGPPTLIEAWLDDEELNAYDLTEGSRPPEADDEVALNVGAADDGNFELGDLVTLASQFGNVEYTLVGTFTFGEAESAAGAVSAEFTLAEAQRLAGAEGQLDAIYVAADDGISQDEITSRIAEVLPGGTEVVTGEEASEQDADSVQEGLRFFSIFLTVFGVIALLVSIFIIYNTFQILLAQRTRELALLRAVGASRPQVLRSVLVEAVVVGLVAAVLGIVAGVALAAGITALMGALGAELPSRNLVISPSTIIIGLVVGVLVTLVAAIAPAIKATRVPPLAAMRDVAIERTSTSKFRLVPAAVFLGLGAVCLSRAWTADGDTDAIPIVGLGALLIVIGAIIIGPVLAAPSVRLIGAFLPRLKGVTGRLATENAARSPKRTSATAAALLIGVALVGFVTVIAESATASVESEVNRGLSADLFIQPSGGPFGGFFGFSPEVAAAVEEVDGVDAVARFGAAEVRVAYPAGGTADTFAGSVEPDVYGEMATPKMVTGDLSDLDPGTVLVDRQIAEDNDLEVGSEIIATFPGGGQVEVTVAGISDDLVVLTPWTFHADDFGEAVDQPLDFQVLATVSEGSDVAEVQGAVEAALEPFPGLSVLDREGFIGDLADTLTSFVYFIYGLLALSIIIAMIGVANTLSLSIHERTRELGLLRAVGMARNQLKSSIRWEAVLIAVLGTLVGLGLGLIASYAIIKALEGFGLTTFAVPVVTLVIGVILAAGFGVLASLLAARRAARLDILQAIAHE